MNNKIKSPAYLTKYLVNKAQVNIQFYLLFPSPLFTTKNWVKLLKYFPLIVILAFGWSGCRSEYKHPVPDVSDIEVEVTLINFDSLLAVHVEKGPEEIEKIIEKYPAFAPLYFYQILEIANPEEPLDSVHSRLSRFIESEFYRDITDTINRAYPNYENIRRDFQSSLAYYKHYFPYRSIPVIYLFISEFAYGNIIFDHGDGRDGLGIGIDMFLDGYFDYSQLAYFNTAFSAYNIRTLNEAHIVKKSFDAVWDDILGPPKGVRMIDLMLHYGKKHYLNTLVQPHKPDTILFEFSAEQLEWVESNEHQIYNHLIENELLYSTDRGQFARLVEPSPHSPGMPPEAPGQVVNWLAYKMILAWLSNNPDQSLEQLLNTTNGQEFLLQSKYRPGRY